jgi:uroporphyrinogen decarboxylase
MGGVDQGAIMDRSVPEIKAEVDDAIAQVDGRNLILAPGCTIVSQVPQHILQALMSAAREPLIDETQVTA